MIKKYCYANGRITTLDQARVAINDLSLLRGYGVFDFLRTYNNSQPFKFYDHFARFQHSAKLLNLNLPITAARALKITNQLINKNNQSSVGIRFILTAGNSQNSLTADQSKLFILIEDLTSLPSLIYRRGGKLITIEHKRECPQAKHINYLTAISLKSIKIKKQAVEILYLNRGRALECATSNFFIIRDQKLITPQDSILLGITRQEVIKLAQTNLGLKVLKRPITVKEFKQADEAFITATNKEIVPIVKIDDQIIGNGRVGDQTKKIIQQWVRYTKSDN